MQPSIGSIRGKSIALIVGILIVIAIFIWIGFSVKVKPLDNSLPVTDQTPTSKAENTDLKDAKLANQTRIEGDMRQIDIENSFYKIHASYPGETLDTKYIMRDYVEYIVMEKMEEWKVDGELYMAEQEINADFPDRKPVPYELNITYKKYEAPLKKTVTYVFMTYEFTGGAHGNTVTNTFTFGVDAQGKPKAISIQDILSFENGNDIALTRLLAEKLPAVLGEYAQKDMIENGLGLTYLKPDGKTFDAEKCHCDGFFYGSNLQNFIVRDDGLTFILGQYQVAPYVSGMPEVKFTWKELESFLLIDPKIESKIDL